MKSLACLCCVSMVLAWATACGGSDSQGPTLDSITTDVAGNETLADDVQETADTPRDDGTDDAVKPDTAEPVEVIDVPPVETDAADTPELPEFVPACQTAADCDDSDPCTQDACDTAADKCTHTALNGCKACKLDKDCDDGDGCTQDLCDGLVCKHQAVPVAGCTSCQGSATACDDANDCTTDTCNDKGYCEHTCDCVATCGSDQGCWTAETNLCNPSICAVSKGAGACRATACATTPVNCDDSDACTVDSCDLATGTCKNVKIPNCGPCASDTECDDGNACTVDSCSPDFLVCVHAADPCEDADPCTVDVCNPTVGCQHLNTCVILCAADLDCDDKNACTTDTCDVANGLCSHGLLGCDDGIACTKDSCDAVAGCKHLFEGTPCTDDAGCADGAPCTADTCDGASGCCAHAAIPACKACAADADCNDNNPCTDDVCDTTTLTCTITNSTAACDDGSACTQGEACRDGKCQGGTLLTCGDSDPCTADTCDPALGCVHPLLRGCGACTADTDCDDKDLCTTDVCDPTYKVCRHTHLACNDNDPCTDDLCKPLAGCTYTPNATACTDGDACTLGDVCSQGACQAGTGAPSCDDKNQCTSDSCDPTFGCRSTALAGACDDADPCTTGEACAGGLCQGGAPVSCDDADVCTVDSCVAGVGCANVPVNCDDKDPCTIDSCDKVVGCLHTLKDCVDADLCTVDSCDGTTGECAHATVECTDGNACTDDTCDAAIGCVFTPNGNACDDGDACTVADKCTNGSCAGGAPLNCDDQNGCTTDTCDSKTGCVWANNTLPCDDGVACTQNDVCGGTGTCAGTAYACVAPDACHLEGTCVGDGTCKYPNANDATPCDDANKCTTGDACYAGVCAGTSVVTCTASDACHDIGTCDPATGTCTNPAKTDGAPCDDANKCTLGDSCIQGTCKGAPNPCHEKPDNTCTDDYCSKDLAGDGCYHTYRADGAACEDGNACTGGDTCKNTVCQAGPLVACSDGNDCTDDSCDPAIGCVFKNNTTKCNDGVACTKTDVCTGGACLGTPYACPAPDACHEPGTCNGDGTCSYAAKTDGTACNDGNLCTQKDTCKAGVCTGADPVACTAQDQCHAIGLCDPATGTCTNPPKSDATPCDDGVKCTIKDACSAGVCTGVANPCEDGNTCTGDACSEALPGDGCYHNPVDNGTACDDKNACTTADTCQSGACTGGPALNCANGNPCSTDTCNPASGCVHTANTLPCDDGITCTVGDKCANFVCVGGPKNDSLCNDGRKCSADSCVPGVGCQNTHISSCTCGGDGDCAVGYCCRYQWWPPRNECEGC